MRCRVALTLLAGGLLSSGQIIRAESFTFTTINVPGAATTFPTGVNNRGDVVGFYSDSSGVAHAYLDTKGVITNIDFPGVISGTDPNGINDSGQIVGSLAVVRSNENTFVPYLDTKGVFSILSVPESSFAVANGINDRGQIVGDFRSISQQGFSLQGFLYSKGVFTTIDYPGAVYTALGGINDEGQIVGSYFDDHFLRHGFLYANGVFTAFNFPGSGDTMGIGINDRGEIVGNIPNGSFLYAHGAFTPIQFPIAGASTGAEGINDAGRIVGNYENPMAANGFLATPTHQSASLLATQPEVTATPTPEPASFLLIGCGLAGAVLFGGCITEHAKLWGVRLRRLPETDLPAGSLDANSGRHLPGCH